MELLEKRTRKWLQQNLHKTYNNTSPQYQEALQLIQKHPNYEWYQINGIKKIKITRSIMKKNIEVSILNNNNKWIPISWLKCIYPNRKSTDKLTSAMRLAIKDQILEYKKNCKKTCCDTCNSCIKLEVEHIVPFNKLKSDFLNNRNDIPKKFYYNNNTVQPSIYDSKFKYDWLEYHQNNAKLTILCSKCNKKSWRINN